jgi:hypothetical protein
MAERRACTFCQRRDRKIGAEHAWPSWLRTLLHDGPSTVTFARHNRARRQWPSPADSLGVTVKDVCTHRNNGEMSALEVSVQPYLTPLLTGQSVELSREALRTIAKWIYKTAMVFDIINPVNGLRYFTDDERHALMATLEPAPDQPLMWLAAYTGENIATAVDYRIAYDLTRAKDRTGTGEGYLSTITAGPVALQMLTFRGSQQSSRLTLPKTRWDEATIWCWPGPRVTSPVLWPPTDELDNSSLSLFIDRWRPKSQEGAE